MFISQFIFIRMFSPYLDVQDQDDLYLYYLQEVSLTKFILKMVLLTTYVISFHQL